MEFNRALHNRLPNPLAGAYQKAFNSPARKDLHDNALHFGLALMRLLAMISVSLLRTSRSQLSEKDAGLVTELHRASEGHWRQLLVRSLVHLRQNQLAPDSLAVQIDDFCNLKRKTPQSGLPTVIGHLQSYMQQKIITRPQATVHEFFETLVEYRNKALGHNVVLPDEINYEHGKALLAAAEEVALLVPCFETWDMKYVDETTLDQDAVHCRCINLTGAAWLREPPRHVPLEATVPPRTHVILSATAGPPPFVDLHPLVVFRDGRTYLFNGAANKPTYQDYSSSHQLKLPELADDYAQWKASLIPGADQAPIGQSASNEGAHPAGTARFRLDRLLGRGGMGEVWLAYDETLKRRVAIKRLRSELVGEPIAFQRFLQEARDVARLNHPNIVQILSIEHDEQGVFLVLEYMEGGSLRERILREPLKLREALAHLRQLLQALAYAHEQGVIHRDIKPENVLLTRAGLPKLADFGLAWLVDSNLEASVTVPQRVAEGTQHYVAPELVSGHDQPSAQTDLFSLGVTFYEMLTGEPAHPIKIRKVASAALPLVQKLVYDDPNLRYDAASAALNDCLELERALELAGRNEAETQARMEQTLQQAYGLLAAGKLVDARAGLERLLAENPEYDGARVGMFVLHLAGGDFVEAAQSFSSLTASESQAPAFLRIKSYFASIERPTKLILEAAPMPFSYQTAELARGKLVKVGSSRVDLQACKLEYSIVSPK